MAFMGGILQILDALVANAEQVAQLALNVAQSGETSACNKAQDRLGPGRQEACASCSPSMAALAHKRGDSPRPSPVASCAVPELVLQLLPSRLAQYRLKLRRFFLGQNGYGNY